MPSFQRYANEGFPYFVTTVVKNRKNIFAQQDCCQILMDGISFLRAHLGHRVHGYVIMPDHVHLVVTPREGGNISQVMHSLKLYSARQIGALLGSKGGIWQARFYERALRTRKDVDATLAYIHDNPVEARMVVEPGEYHWSSYRACMLGEPEPVEIDVLDW